MGKTLIVRNKHTAIIHGPGMIAFYPGDQPIDDGDWQRVAPSVQSFVAAGWLEVIDPSPAAPVKPTKPRALPPLPKAPKPPEDAPATDDKEEPK
jgi:hypothetical protein